MHAVGFGWLGIEGLGDFGVCVSCGRYVCWQKAFPEYGVSYGSVLKAIEKVERDLPGLYYAGGAHVVASK